MCPGEGLGRAWRYPVRGGFVYLKAGNPTHGRRQGVWYGGVLAPNGAWLSGLAGKGGGGMPCDTSIRRGASNPRPHGQYAKHGSLNRISNSKLCRPRLEGPLKP